MDNMMIKLKIAFLLLIFLFNNTHADTVNARCDIYPKGSDRIDKMIACDFSQRQGYIHIKRDDGIEYNLSPKGDLPGNYVDAKGRAAFRQSGLGKDGHIYRLHDVSVFVYWDASALNAAYAPGNLTVPFTTRDYDATSMFRCGPDVNAKALCNAGILRLGNQSADISIMSPSGNLVTLKFRKQQVTSKGHKLKAALADDMWQIDVDGKVHYQIPLAAVEGG